MPDEINNINTRPTDPTAATVVPSGGKTRTVKLDPTYCPAGSMAMVAGKLYTVGDG